MNQLKKISDKIKLKPLMAILVLIVGTFLLLNIFNSLNTYEDISLEPDTALKLLESTSTKRELTLILYRKDCKSCKSVEPQLVKLVKTTRNKNTSSIIVMDVHKLNKSQLRLIQEKIPDILIDNTKIPTPLVANLVINTDGRIIVKEQSTTNDFKKLKILIIITKQVVHKIAKKRRR